MPAFTLVRGDAETDLDLERALMAIGRRASTTLDRITALANDIERDPAAQPVAQAFALGYALGMRHAKQDQS